jgi:hypothetical protein
MALESGSRLGSYEVLALIGRGGMGEVYRARDLKLNRDVAIKCCLNTWPATRSDSRVFTGKRRRWPR